LANYVGTGIDPGGRYLKGQIYDLGAGAADILLGKGYVRLADLASVPVAVALDDCLLVSVTLEDSLA
jgi:hypothetical protein